jgi:hypothetical protein
LSLLRASVLCFKQRSLYAEFSDRAQDAMTYALLAEDSTGRPHTALLDEMDRTLQCFKQHFWGRSIYRVKDQAH